MNSVNNGGSIGFFNVLQRGLTKAIEVVSAAGRTIVRNLSEIPRIPRPLVPLMRSTQSLAQVLAQPIDGGTFSELPATPLGDMFGIWSPKYVNFIRNHCMKRFEECVGNGVTTIEDLDKVFVARSEFAPDISVAQAQDFGFILPGNICDLMERNPNLKIKPLVIRCFGVGSGSTVAQIQEGAKNILSLSTDRLTLSNALVLSHIESVRQRFESDPNVLVIPFMTGFSMGGMFASAIALQNNFPSMVFNGLGLGKAGCDFVGEENWARAQRQPNSHVAMFVDHDFVASPDSSWRNVTKIPGHIVSIPGENSANPTLGEEREIHCAYKKYFDRVHQNHLVSRAHADV